LKELCGARLIDGISVASSLKERLRGELLSHLSAGDVARRPTLATLLVGTPHEAVAYERRLRDLTGELGFGHLCASFEEEATEAEVLETLHRLDADESVCGILILKPLPDHIPVERLSEELSPAKDVEGIHPYNAGLLALGRPRYVPSTPKACFLILDDYLKRSGRDPREFYERSHIVVIGRSANVGRAALQLAMRRGATVTSCDVNTYRAGRLREFTGQADVLISAAGVAGLIDESHVKEGVIAIDVGINPVEGPGDKVRLVGDMDTRSVAKKAEAITPVPGGVGPVTDVCLLENVLLAARAT